MNNVGRPQSLPISYPISYWMYLFWVGGLVLLYFLCSWYARFKAQKAPDSIWRMF